MVTNEVDPRLPPLYEAFDPPPPDPGSGGLLIAGTDTRCRARKEHKDPCTPTPIGETSNERSRVDVPKVGVDGTTPKIGESPICNDAC